MMHNPEFPQEAIEERLRRLCTLLSGMARLMSEQAEFHSGALMDLGLDRMREAATLAESRMGRLSIAGNRWRREIEKTMLTNLARGVFTSHAILGEAGTEAWPDLFQALEGARHEIAQAALRDPSFFMPEDFRPDLISEARPAPFLQPQGWRELDGECYVRLETDKIPIAVVGWGNRDNKTWLAQAGGIGVGFYADPALAAQHAEEAYELLFGPSRIAGLSVVR